MIKLFVDDWRLPPPGWTLVRTITGATELLSTGRVEMLSLDHDIQLFPFGEVPVPELYKFSSETFSAVARFVAVMPPSLRPKLIFLHSANLAGAKLMRDILIPSRIPIIKVDSEYYRTEIAEHLKNHV